MPQMTAAKCWEYYACGNAQAIHTGKTSLKMFIDILGINNY